LGACSSALEVELVACVERCRLTRQWINLPCIVELDCLEAVILINLPGEDRSATTDQLKEIKFLLVREREFRVQHINREQNSVSHALANLGRTEAMSNFWLSTGPLDIPQLCIKVAILIIK
jgi:hypothetical protein